jgi:hypothetical protein
VDAPHKVSLGPAEAGAVPGDNEIATIRGEAITSRLSKARLCCLEEF